MQEISDSSGMVEFVLVGPQAGETVIKGKRYHFKKGVILAPINDADKLARTMATYGAFRKEIATSKQKEFDKANKKATKQKEPAASAPAPVEKDYSK